MQLTHENYTPSPITKNLILICDHIKSPSNTGALFRSADAFGVEEIIFIGGLPQINSGRFKSLARGTEKYVHFRESKDGKTTLDELHQKGYLSIALEITVNSVPIQKLPNHATKLALIIGSENHGVSHSLLRQVNLHAHITMFGKNSSMNVAQAAAIAFFELTRS